MKYSICALVASVGCIILSCLLLFWNPYVRTPMDDKTILFVFIMLILPACIGILAAILRNRMLMLVVLLWSLPYGVYLAVASIPSVWNLYGAVLILYAISLGRLSVK
jgi:hypothetical protein